MDPCEVSYGIMRHSQHPDKPHPYHITIGNLNSFRDNPAHMRQLDYLRRRYAEPFEYDLWIQDFGGGNTAQLHNRDRVYQDMIDLYHADARAKGYQNLPTPHVSMMQKSLRTHRV